MRNPTRVTIAALAALFVHTSIACAGAVLQPSPLALDPFDLGRAARAPVTQALEVVHTVPQLLLAQQGYPNLPSLPVIEAAPVEYKPRTQSTYHDENSRPIVTQMHGGYFNADKDETAPFVVGVRGGPMVDQRLQVGLGIDWLHQTKNISNVLSTSTGPIGVPISTKQDSARALVNLVPIQAFAQISGWGLLGLVPYVGASGGYQVLVLSSDNFITGQSFEATFGGWGYQVWAGAGMPLGKRSRFIGEVFINRAELGHDVTDPNNGESARQTVNMNGVGVRFGLAWGYASPDSR